jgi:hypothetical protein
LAHFCSREDRSQEHIKPANFARSRQTLTLFSSEPTSTLLEAKKIPAAKRPGGFV